MKIFCLFNFIVEIPLNFFLGGGFFFQVSSALSLSCLCPPFFYSLIMADKVLESLFCSICIGLINDPVSIETGHSFCRECISRWFLTSYTCPMTNKRLSTKTVIPNHTLRTVIDDYQQQHCKKIPRSSVELHEQIGRGSFKVVYKATLTLPNQPWCIGVLRIQTF